MSADLHKQSDPQSKAMLTGVNNQTNTIEISYHGVGSEIKLNAEVAIMNPVLEHALKLVADGIPVFPCKPDKSPYTKNGFKNASINPEQVKAWWNQFSDAMIGMPTGKASGIWVLDIDTAKNGETVNGYASCF